MSDFARQNYNLHLHSEEIADKLNVMANANRLKILCHLASGPLSVGELEEKVELSQSAISQHLAKMRHAGVLYCKKDAQTRYYFIKDDSTLRFMLHLYDIFCADKETV